MSENMIEMREISKQFNNIWVLKNVSFKVEQAEVHTLFGENGAGKSVLMKILSGILQPDLGEIWVKGEKVPIATPLDAQQLGIRTIHQEQNLFPDLTVAENIFISRIPSVTNKAGIVQWSKMYNDCAEILKSFHFKINPRDTVKDLGPGERQMVEIAKALAYKSSVIIMDEPTGSLTDIEIENLFGIIGQLKQKGISVIYISHRIEEVLKISDRITIIRDGEIIETNRVKGMNRESLINLSAGKDVKERYPKLPVIKGRVFFKVENLCTDRRINGISFEVRKGEVLGIAGLLGSGRTAIARAIFGMDKLSNGEIYLNGTKLHIHSPSDAIEAGIGFVSEERLTEGLIGDFNIPENITLSNPCETRGKFFLKLDKEKEVARRFIKKLVIKVPFVEEKVKNLSGGNQQKVVLSKWLFSSSKLFILDEPTIGLDTGSKVEVYNIMNEIVLNGSSVILISSDLSELIGMSDRVLVIFNGRIIRELTREELSPQKILYYASGGGSTIT
jgi:ribose transport system ATP-binding protein